MVQKQERAAPWPDLQASVRARTDRTEIAADRGPVPLGQRRLGRGVGEVEEAEDFLLPGAALIYFISALAEAEQTPFDLLEAESELVAGYVSEYSGLMFAMFFLAEFANMFLVSGIAATVFLGGWLIPFFDAPELTHPGLVEHPRLWVQVLGLLSFWVKAYFLVVIMMWIRWTFPRLRPDHLMNFGWKFMLPVAFLNLLGSALAVLLYQAYDTYLAFWAVGIVLVVSVVLIMRALKEPPPYRGPR